MAFRFATAPCQMALITGFDAEEWPAGANVSWNVVRRLQNAASLNASILKNIQQVTFGNHVFLSVYTFRNLEKQFLYNSHCQAGSQESLNQVFMYTVSLVVYYSVCIITFLFPSRWPGHCLIRTRPTAQSIVFPSSCTRSTVLCKKSVHFWSR